MYKQYKKAGWEVLRRKGSHVVFPMPDKEVKGENIVKVPVYPKIGFSYSHNTVQPARVLAYYHV